MLFICFLFLRLMKCFLPVLALFTCLTALAQEPVLIHGHAHNDYAHKRPLFDALENSFGSVEADIFYYRGQLKVAHVPLGLGSKQTLDQLYLHPLDSIIQLNGGSVYKGQSTPLILMIDFKDAGHVLYPVLQEAIKPYHNWLTLYQGDSIIRKGAVQLLISGSRPKLNDDTCYVTLDEDLSSLARADTHKHATRYSSGWGRFFSWNGKGEMPATQKQVLDTLVAQVHALHKQIRFYHIPDKENTWKVLLNAGVDWINTDKLKLFRRYYRGR